MVALHGCCAVASKQYISYSGNFLNSPLRVSCFMENAVLLLSTRCGPGSSATIFGSEIRVLVDLQSDHSHTCEIG